MTARCEQPALAHLTDYAVGELTADEAAAIEDHLFTCAACGARAAELEALARAIGPAFRLGAVGGFVTDEVLNRLAREGLRIRSYILTPGAVVPCAVWDGDELMAVRMRADCAGVTEVTLSQRVGGEEVIRATAPLTGGSQGEIIYAIPAAWVRELPAVEVQVLLTANAGGVERTLGRYTLAHEGSLRR